MITLYLNSSLKCLLFTAGSFVLYAVLCKSPLLALLIRCIIVLVPYSQYIRTCSQRGLLCIVDIYCMRLYCYDCYSEDDATKELLFKCSAWVSTQPLGLRFFIREDRLSLALIADVYLIARPKLDYYA